MATISSGSVTITIQPGEQYRVIASGEAYVDIGGGSTQSYRLINGSSERLLGGFIIATPVTIRVVSGSVDYINVSGTGDSVALSLAQSSRTDITGFMASTASGDLISPNGLKLQVASVFKGNQAVLFGDSFTARNNTGGVYRDTDWGYFTWANNLLNHPFNVVKNSGVSGNTTTQMLARLSADVLAYNPNWVFFQGGINDFSGGATVDTVVANSKSIIQQITAQGINVVYMSIAPNATNGVKVILANQAMREWITRNNIPNVQYVDTYSLLVNPTDTTGAFTTGMSDDALHLSPKGARYYGTAIYNALKNIVVSSNALVASAADSVLIDATSKQLLQNPLMSGTTGTVSGTGASGTVSTNWTAGTSAGTVTNVWAANQTRSDGIGVDQQVTITSAGSNAAVNIRQSNIQSRFAIGDTVYFSGSITVTGASDLKSIVPTLQFTIDGSTVLCTTFEQNGSSVTYDQGNLTINFQTPDITLSGTTISAALAKIEVSFGTSGAGAAVIKLGRLGVFKR